MSKIERKFRAWHIGEKKMYNDVCVMFCPNELRKYRIYTASDGKFLGNDKHFEIMQSTGREDKNGKEIYEEDIVKRKIYRSTETHVVKFGTTEIKDNEDYNSNTVYGFYLKEVNPYDNDEWHMDFMEDREIIGDIHRNLELIETNHD